MLKDGENTRYRIGPFEIQIERWDMKWINHCSKQAIERQKRSWFWAGTGWGFAAVQFYIWFGNIFAYAVRFWFYCPWIKTVKRAKA